MGLVVRRDDPSDPRADRPQQERRKVRVIGGFGIDLAGGATRFGSWRRSGLVG